jgi:hypothetical protein
VARLDPSISGENLQVTVGYNPLIRDSEASRAVLGGATRQNWTSVKDIEGIVLRGFGAAEHPSSAR